MVDIYVFAIDQDVKFIIYLYDTSFIMAERFSDIQLSIEITHCFMYYFKLIEMINVSPAHSPQPPTQDKPHHTRGAYRIPQSASSTESVEPLSEVEEKNGDSTDHGKHKRKVGMNMSMM